MKSLWNAQRSIKWEKDMVFDSWFRSLWNDRSEILIKTHVRFTDETTVQNSQKSAWLFFVCFEQPKIRRKARGRFSVETTDLKCAEKRVLVFRSFWPKNNRSVFEQNDPRSFKGHLGQNDRSSGLLGKKLHVISTRKILLINFNYEVSGYSA